MKTLMGLIRKAVGRSGGGPAAAPAAHARPSSSSRASSARVATAHVSRDAVPRQPIERLRHHMRRTPRVLWALGTLIVVVVLGVWMQKFLFESQYFTIQDWQIHGTQRLLPEDVRRLAAGNAPDDPSLNLLRYSPRAAEARLLEHPVIRDAEVHRVFPHRVVVSIDERRQTALHPGPQKTWLVDDDGVLFAEAHATELLDTALPILTVADDTTTPRAVGDRLPAEFHALARLYLATLAEARSPLADEIAELHWDNATGLELVLNAGTRLRCGWLPPAETLPKAEALWSRWGAMPNADYADLRLDSHVAWKPLLAPTPVKQTGARRQAPH